MIRLRRQRRYKASEVADWLAQWAGTGIWLPLSVREHPDAREIVREALWSAAMEFDPDDERAQRRIKVWLTPFHALFQTATEEADRHA